MINPSSPARQMIGVYSLELARLYNYLYQKSDIQYTIVHSLDGYDEVSLTGAFKYILNGVEQILTPDSIRYEITDPSDLRGGQTVDESAAIFNSILECRGTKAQNNVVLANTQLAIKCCFPSKSPEECRTMAEDSLFSRKASKAFTRLIELQS